MPNPLVIAYHLIWTGYGWWLPNDPRGSGSKIVRQDVIAELGDLHFGRKQVQPLRRELREFYQQAAHKLMHPLLTIDDAARSIIGEAFRRVIERDKFTCYACVIMPDHVHMVIRKHKFTAEEMIMSLMAASRESLILAGWCDENHPVWPSSDGWNVFLEHPDDVRRTIGYIERNPDPIGLPRQIWPFVKTYDGWPLHPGHSPNSPYVQRLRAAGRYP